MSYYQQHVAWHVNIVRDDHSKLNLLITFCDVTFNTPRSLSISTGRKEGTNEASEKKEDALLHPITPIHVCVVAHG